MSEETGLLSGVQSFIHSTFGEQLWGIPMTPIVICAFICGVALFYLVMQRQLRRDAEDIG